jgi:hypothetical protein
MGHMSFTSWQPNMHTAVVRAKPARFTVRGMNLLVRFVQSLGNAGAVRNAWRSCEERRLTEQRIQSLSERLTATSSVPAWPTTTASGG